MKYILLTILLIGLLFFISPLKGFLGVTCVLLITYGYFMFKVVLDFIKE